MSELFLTAQRDRPLTGLCVLVTRPLQQAQQLIHSLQAQGASTLHQPCIDIKACFNESQAALLAAIDNYDYVIFISKNAVEYGFALFKQTAHRLTSPVLAAIGQASSKALAQHTDKSIISPENGFDSEALLDCAEFSAQQIRAKKILIIRGGQGRPHLQDVLEQRQATVDCLDVYQRLPADRVLSNNDFQRLDVLTVSSQHGLENLLSMLDINTRTAILDKILITPSLRCSQKARELGFKHIETADNATDDAMLDCIIRITTEQQKSIQRDVKS